MLCFREDSSPVSCLFIYTLSIIVGSHESILVAITAPKPQTARAKPPHLLLYVFSMGRELWLSKLKLDTARNACAQNERSSILSKSYLHSEYI